MAEWLPFCAVLSEALVQTRLAEARRVVLRALEGHVRRRAADLVADALRGPGPNQPNDQPTNPWYANGTDARDRNCRFGPLSALRAHTNGPCETGLL